jgi:hypothetical protein
MKPITFLCAVGISILLLRPSLADKEPRPISFVVTSEFGQSFFKMIPPKGKWQENKYVTTKEAVGVAYSIDEDGNFIELWRTSGWYSSELYLSLDGQYLVRMGPWNEGHEPNNSDLAVAFYKNGNLLKEYSVIDLVKDKSKIQPTRSHYFWLARMDYRNLPDMERKKWEENRLRLDGSNNVFHLKTIDGIMYQFDATTGEIKKTDKP